VTELDRTALDRLLPAASGSADWNDVLRRSGTQQRRHRMLVVVATVVLVAIAAASAFAMRAVVLDKGFIGLPPIGATPSSPASGELEIYYWVNFVDPKGEITRREAWVYADGRLIWLEGGFVERRLTPEGVELLRSETLSTGEFGHEPAPPACPQGQSPSGRTKVIASDDCSTATAGHDPDKPLTIPFDTTVEVAGHGRLVHVDQARDYFRLEERLAHPVSWLPDSAWVERDGRAYVASKYAICYGGWPPDQQVEKSGLLALLPQAVRGPLGDAPRRQGPLFGEPGHFRPSYEYCSDMATDEARAVAVALDDAGIQRHSAARLHYRIEAPGSDPGEVNVWFEPYLPNGEIVCTVCG
jgi:hypothetical protein